MLRNGRVSAPALAALATLSVLVTASSGCASRGGVAASVRSAPGDDGPAATSAVEAVTVTGATLLSEGETPKLLLSATGPLTPTVYTRDEGRRIVVDLANVIASPGLEPPRVDGAIFSHVGMRSFQELGKPHLQFEFNGRVALESRLGTEPGLNALAISFLRKVDAERTAPASMVAVAPSPAPAAGAAATMSAASSGAAALVEPEPIRVETLPTRGSSPSEGVPSVSVVSAGAGSQSTQSTQSTQSPAASEEPEILVRHTAEGRAASRLNTLSARASGGNAVVTLSGNGEFSYEAFVLTNPPRYVIDLRGVKNGASRKTQDVADANVTRVRVSQFRSDPEPVTRVVLDLASSVLPSIAQAEAGLTLRFGDAQVASAAVSEAPVRSPARVETPAAASYEPHEEADLPGAETIRTTAPAAPEPAAAEGTEVSEAAVPASTTSPSPSGAVETQVASERGATATASSAEPPAEARISVTEETDPLPAAAVVSAGAPTTSEAPQIVASTPEVIPSVEPSVPARRRKATIEDQALVEAAEALLLQQEGGSKKDLSNPYESKTIGGADKIYTGEPITLNLKDADIKDTLQRFSELTGLNIVLDPRVSGTVTVSLTDIPWDQALELILKINGLGYVLEGNVMRIAPNEKLASEETMRKKLLEAQELNRPVKTVIQRISYAGAQDVANTAKSVMSPRGDIFIDGRSNTLIIKELPDYLPTVLDLIRSLDQPTPQVIIEARIVEATRNFSRNLGIDWSFLGRADQQHGNTTGLVFPNSGSVGGAVSLPNGPTVLGFSLKNVLDTFRLDMALSAAEARGLVKLISTPKVQTQTNQKASIQSGFQIPVQTTVNNTTTVLYIDATLRLDVTPQITSEGTIILDVAVQKREPAIALNVAGGSNVPLTTRDAKTRLMVRDGGTAVIGGIFKLTSNDGQSMIPGLWKIPLLGNLFRNRTISETSDELMIFITPRIIKN